MVNNLIPQSLRSAGIPAILEPPGLFPSDGKRSDGATLIPWSCGRSLVWDFICPDTLALSHLVNTSHVAAPTTHEVLTPRWCVNNGAAASVAETRKVAKYSALSSSHRFIPVAIETMGVWRPGAMEFLKDLGAQLTVHLGELQAFGHLRKSLDIAIQRGNAMSVLGTFPIIFTGMV